MSLLSKRGTFRNPFLTEKGKECVSWLFLKLFTCRPIAENPLFVSAGLTHPFKDGEKKNKEGGMGCRV
jgi:hypothetical protein